MPSKTQLPAEVIDRIVTIFGDVEIRWPNCGQLGPAKRHLGVFAQTCRHWARRIRPQMFEEITLRDRDDFFRFLALVDSPVQAPPSLIECVQAVVLLNVGAWSRPWLHLVSAEIRRRKDALDFAEGIDEITFQLEAAYVPQANAVAESHAGYAPRSWCAGLPRSLPSGVFPIETMELSKLRFQTPRALIRLIRSTPSLADLACTSLEFDDWSDPSFGAVGRPRQGPNRLCAIATFACGSETQNLDLLLLVARSQLPHAVVKPGLSAFSGWDSLRCLARSVLLAGSPTRVELRAMFRPRSIPVPTTCDLSLDYWHPDDSQAIPTRFRHTHGLTFNIQLTPDPAALAALHSIELLGPNDINDAQAINWQALEAAVTDMQPDTPTTLRVRDRPTFLWFLDNIPAKKILRELYSTRQIVVEHRRMPQLTLESILSAPYVYVVDGETVTLSRAQVVQLASYTGESRKEAFLRDVVAGT